MNRQTLNYIKSKCNTTSVSDFETWLSLNNMTTEQMLMSKSLTNECLMILGLKK